jgi:hypothetical protein
MTVATVGARGTRESATSAHSCDRASDISGPLLLALIVAMDDVTSDDHCYCWARGMCTVAIGAHSSNVPYDIRGPLLLWGHVAHTRFLLAPIAVTGSLTSVGYCYYHPLWRRATRHHMTVATIGHVAHMWLLLAHIVATGILTSVAHRHLPP